MLGHGRVGGECAVEACHMVLQHDVTRVSADLSWERRGERESCALGNAWTYAVQAGSLDNISRRFSWFNRILKTYEQEHAAIFPNHWRVNEILANAFCEGTREDFRAILQQSARRTNGQSLDVNLLLSCLQQTLDFEHALERRLADDVSSLHVCGSSLLSDLFEAPSVDRHDELCGRKASRLLAWDICSLRAVSGPVG